MPRQRFCFCDVNRTIWRGGNHVPGRRWCLVLSHDRNTGCIDLNRVCSGTIPLATWKGNKGRALADVREQKSEIGHQMSDVRCQMSDVRCQMSDVRCQMSDVRCQMSDVRCQMSDVRCQTSAFQ